jgi:hypothetical protein
VAAQVPFLRLLHGHADHEPFDETRVPHGIAGVLPRPVKVASTNSVRRNAFGPTGGRVTCYRDRPGRIYPDMPWEPKEAFHAYASWRGPRSSARTDGDRNSGR